MSGRRDSNPRPSAWKANALSTELLPQICGGQGWIRTTEGVSQQIYSLPHLATLVLAQQYFKKSGRRGSNPRPSAWKANALSTELLPQKPKTFQVSKSVGKDGFEPPKSKDSRFTVCPIWPLWYLPNLLSKNNSFSASFLEPLVGFEPTTPRLQITCSGQLS